MMRATICCSVIRQRGWRSERVLAPLEHWKRAPPAHDRDVRKGCPLGTRVVGARHAVPLLSGGEALPGVLPARCRGDACVVPGVWPFLGGAGHAGASMVSTRLPARMHAMPRKQSPTPRPLFRWYSPRPSALPGREWRGDLAAGEAPSAPGTACAGLLSSQCGGNGHGLGGTPVRG
jgi:hypothetical protein